jgi:hypothetical protein
MDTEEFAKISIDRFADQLLKPEAVLFWQYLDENPSAKQMLTGLHQAGCDPLTLMTLQSCTARARNWPSLKSRSGQLGTLCSN